MIVDDRRPYLWIAESDRGYGMQCHTAIPRSLIAQDGPLWGEPKETPPEGGSIPGLLGVRARTPGTRGCTFLRVFNNSPSRDRILLFFHFLAFFWVPRGTHL